MNSRQWVRRTLLSTIAVGVILIASFVLVDPYQVFGTNVTEKKFFFESTMTPTRFFHLLREDRYTLLFGTSRSRQLQRDGTDSTILNFGSLYGNSINVLEFLRQLDPTQIKNIDQIYYLVDDHCLNGYDQGNKYSKYQKQDFSESKTLYKIKYALSLDLDKIHRTFQDVKHNLSNEYAYYMGEHGSMVRTDKDESFEVPHDFKRKSTPQFYTEDGINALIEIDKLCKEKKIEIAYFTPTHFQQYNRVLDPKIIEEKWSKLLDNGLDGFYALWSIDGVSDLIVDNRYVAFKDLRSHLNEGYDHHLFISNVAQQSREYYISNSDGLVDYLAKKRDDFKD